MPHAVAIANALGARLTLLRVLECAAGGAAPADAVDWELQRREARDYIDRLAARFRTGDAEIDAELIEGRAAEEICRWCANRDIDLTVATTHGAGGPSPWALASTARKLLERTPGSLLIVPAGAEPARGGAHYRRLLVPLDGSPHAETSLPIAERIARAHHAELVAAHIVPAPELTQVGPPDAEDVQLMERLQRRNERVARLYLDRLRARIAGEGLAFRAVLLRGGEVASQLASIARTEQVDLIVLAAHGQRPRLNTPCGGTTAELIARSPAPMLIVRARPARLTRRVEAVGPSPIAGRLPQHTMS